MFAHPDGARQDWLVAALDGDHARWQAVPARPVVRETALVGSVRSCALAAEHTPDRICRFGGLAESWPKVNPTRPDAHVPPGHPVDPQSGGWCTVAALANWPVLARA